VKVKRYHSFLPLCFHPSSLPLPKPSTPEDQSAKPAVPPHLLSVGKAPLISNTPASCTGILGLSPRTGAGISVSLSADEESTILPTQCDTIHGRIDGQWCRQVWGMAGGCGCWGWEEEGVEDTGGRAEGLAKEEFGLGPPEENEANGTSVD
jgi:hypothetical protein